MLKSKYNKTSDSYMAYLPFDLLPREYNDVRSEMNLSEYQHIQKLKKLFAAEQIVADDDE